MNHESLSFLAVFYMKPAGWMVVGQVSNCGGFPTRLPGIAACRHAGQISSLRADSLPAQCAVTNRAQDTILPHVNPRAAI
jgi:hypothetical protein